MEDYNMKLVAILTNYNSKVNTIERKISLEPQHLITQINNFSSAVNYQIKENILETITVTGKVPTNIDIRLFCGNLILGYNEKISLEIKNSLIHQIDQFLFNLSYEMRKELSLSIICTSDFQNQRVLRPTSNKKLGDSDEV